MDDARWCGIDTKNRSGSKYDVIEMGWNYYMCEPSAALAVAQLPHLDRPNRRRREIAKFYKPNSANLDWLVTPTVF